MTGPADALVGGQRVERLSFISTPTLTLYQPVHPSASRTALVVFPGGGYEVLAYDLEGTEICTWLNSLGITCALLKYRVPQAGPFPAHMQDLADAQRAVRMVRAHAVEWGVDPAHVGVLGFSAGGHLAAVLGSHAAEPVYPATDAADGLSALPSFSVMIYPAYLTQESNARQIASEVQPLPSTPRTFLVQAEDDPIKVENSLVYYEALKQLKIPAEMHLYAKGGHGYGLRPTELPVTHWPELAMKWFRTLGVLPPAPQ